MAASVTGSWDDAHGRALFIEHQVLSVTANLRASNWKLTVTLIVQRRELGL